jgi:hypothetical protein
MELRDFVKTTLVEIMGAVFDAQVEWNQKCGKGVINPVWDGTERLFEHVQEVDFDVAVTASSGSTGKAGAGIKVFSVDVGASGEKKVEASSVSRIRFKVPIVPPVEVVHGGKPKGAVEVFGDG